MAKTEDPSPPDKSANLASPARVAAFRTGISAESRAAAFLIAKGYRILAKRFRTPHGEIDLVAKKRNLLAFIEVKARASEAEVGLALDEYRLRRVVRAAEALLPRHMREGDVVRIDAIFMTPWRLPRHLTNVSQY